jgi:hypothetical protein
VRDWLRTQEEEPQPAALAYAAGLGIELDDEAPGAIRRAVLLLATGGDPLRGLDLDGRAVTALAADLDRPGGHALLAHGLAELREAAAGLPRVVAAIELLLAEPDLAWRAFAAGVLAESLDE